MINLSQIIELNSYNYNEHLSQNITVSKGLYRFSFVWMPAVVLTKGKGVIAMINNSIIANVCSIVDNDNWMDVRPVETFIYLEEGVHEMEIY